MDFILLRKYRKNINGSTQQCIKIIAEIVINMDIVARTRFSSKLKDSTLAIGYYSYTKRCQSYGTKIKSIITK